MLGSLEAGQSKAELAAQFHEDFAQAWAEVVVTAARRSDHVVGLSGGVFCNALLTKRI